VKHQGHECDGADKTAFEEIEGQVAGTRFPQSDFGLIWAPIHSSSLLVQIELTLSNRSSDSFRRATTGNIPSLCHRQNM